ncbi:hypothetical protein FGO68_gene9594 [Halteria grandinella]|uniref:Uncharacterized protein n=1 Tax=Halteria grandinella TaxID=5974 RepID=A0A8J8T6W1_HALGN|nr:hypothetical protein FGO68_gene9594 [Halteria grandinella]
MGKQSDLGKRKRRINHQQIGTTSLDPNMQSDTSLLYEDAPLKRVRGSLNEQEVKFVQLMREQHRQIHFKRRFQKAFGDSLSQNGPQAFKPQAQSASRGKSSSQSDQVLDEEDDVQDDYMDFLPSQSQVPQEGGYENHQLLQQSIKCQNQKGTLDSEATSFYPVTIAQSLSAVEVKDLKPLSQSKNYTNTKNTEIYLQFQNDHANQETTAQHTQLRKESNLQSNARKSLGLSSQIGSVNISDVRFEEIQSAKSNPIQEFNDEGSIKSAENKVVGKQGNEIQIQGKGGLVLGQSSTSDCHQRSDTQPVNQVTLQSHNELVSASLAVDATSQISQPTQLLARFLEQNILETMPEESLRTLIERLNSEMTRRLRSTQQSEAEQRQCKVKSKKRGALYNGLLHGNQFSRTSTGMSVFFQQDQEINDQLTSHPQDGFLAEKSAFGGCQLLPLPQKQNQSNQSVSQHGSSMSHNFMSEYTM